MQTENYEDSLVGNEKMMLMAKKVRMIMTLFSGTWTRRSKWLCGGRAGGENQCLLRLTSNQSVVEIDFWHLSYWDRLLTSKLTKFWRRKKCFIYKEGGGGRSSLKLVSNNCAISLLSTAVEEKADDGVLFSTCLFNAMSDKQNRSCLPKLSLLNFQQNKNGANTCSKSSMSLMTVMVRVM